MASSPQLLLLDTSSQTSASIRALTAVSMSSSSPLEEEVSIDEDDDDCDSVDSGSIGLPGRGRRLGLFLGSAKLALTRAKNTTKARTAFIMDYNCNIEESMRQNKFPCSTALSAEYVHFIIPTPLFALNYILNFVLRASVLQGDPKGLNINSIGTLYQFSARNVLFLRCTNLARSGTTFLYTPV